MGIIYAIDFEYDGTYLSDFGFIVCSINKGGGATVADAGSAITLETVSMNKGTHFELTSARYDKSLEAVFQICKDPEKYDKDGMEISRNEFRTISAWLNRKGFLPFRAVDQDDIESDICYFNASFNLSKIQIADKTYGIELKMVTDSPFGYGQPFTQNLLFHNVDESGTVFCIGDDYGFVYPDLSVTCLDDGDLYIACDLGRCDFKVENCTSGEVINVDGPRRIITTSSTTHDIANDFNYEFFRLGTNREETTNTVTSKGIGCALSITYNPIIKDVPY